MPFPFTFKLLPPGLSNPFSPLAIAAQPDSQADGSIELEVKRRRPSPGPSPSIAAPISRKRVWQPSFAEPSQSTTTIASTSGYLDTPSKYRDMTGSPVIIEHEFEDVHSGICPFLTFYSRYCICLAYIAFSHQQKTRTQRMCMSNTCFGGFISRSSPF